MKWDLERIVFKLEFVKKGRSTCIMLFSSHRLDAEDSWGPSSWQIHKKPESLNYYKEQIYLLIRNFHITL